LDPCSELTALGYRMARGSTQRLRQLAKRWAYVIAGGDRGQLGFLLWYGTVREKFGKTYSGKNVNVPSYGFHPRPSSISWTT
jgi:hypothetical protein